MTHRGIADEAGEDRNTFGSNISFRADVFNELGGFDVDIGERKGDKNLQGGETELCARMCEEHGQGVWYDPDAEVAHKVFNYRTEFRWLIDRAFWQGYSKRVMESFVDNEGGEENEFLSTLLLRFMPVRLRNAAMNISRIEAKKFLMLGVFTACVGLGYLYAVATRRPLNSTN